MRDLLRNCLYFSVFCTVEYLRTRLLQLFFYYVFRDTYATVANKLSEEFLQMRIEVVSN